MDVILLWRKILHNVNTCSSLQCKALGFSLPLIRIGSSQDYATKLVNQCSQAIAISKIAITLTLKRKPNPNKNAHTRLTI